MTSFDNIIYTLQTDRTHSLQVVKIETVINRGLYRFTLLGMSSRYASDAKDRVYSALRSSELLNLKSDNRKIIINLYPDDTPKKEGFYDLGIALSCIFCVHTIKHSQKILALGGLSLSGKIIATQRLYQAIATAHSHNIPIVACSTEDFKVLNKETLEKLSLYGLTVLHSDNLKELLSKIKFHLETYPENRVMQIEQSHAYETKKPERGKVVCLKDTETALSALYIALCGGHSILIETYAGSLFKKHYNELISHKPIYHFGREIFSRYEHKTLDTEPVPSVVYIENIINNHNAPLTSRQYDSTLAAYTTCPCGYQFSFFEPLKAEKRCICSKRSIIQHKRNIENSFFQYFSMKIQDSCEYTLVNPEHILCIMRQIDMIRQIQFDTYAKIHNLTEKEMFLFPNTDYLYEYRSDITHENLDKEAKKVWTSTSHEDKVLRVAATIQDILDFESGIIKKEKPTLSKQALLLALSYMPKMDF